MPCPRIAGFSEFGRMAWRGQTSKQIPQWVHFALSITATFSEFMAIASTGHFGTQTPQPEHFEASTHGIVNSFCRLQQKCISAATSRAWLLAYANNNTMQ